MLMLRFITSTLMVVKLLHVRGRKRRKKRGKNLLYRVCLGFSGVEAEQCHLRSWIKRMHLHHPTFQKTLVSLLRDKLDFGSQIPCLITKTRGFFRLHQIWLEIKKESSPPVGMELPTYPSLHGIL
ncbi:hypothetical protein V6N11_076691 [Hibiscus sabdariffa]|uniref:Uncharacterized protein n=1 Tax=Hibiscus sabdariffa TaxID=183260 RepID=A0ABR1ZD59_9ROSI